jgi:hypothetical protein
MQCPAWCTYTERSGLSRRSAGSVYAASGAEDASLMLLSGFREQITKVHPLSGLLRSRLRGRSAAVSAAVAVLLLAGCVSGGTSNPVVVEPTASPPSVGTPSASASPSRSAVASPSAPADVPSAEPVPAESNPPGDIPDNIAFVAYRNKPGGYSFTHPEGWAETSSGTAVRFTDKLNGVVADVVTGAQAPTLDSVRTVDVPRLRSAVPAFELIGMDTVSLSAGKGVRIVFRRNSDPDEVTGRVYRDEVEEYEIFRAGKVLRLDLYGPVGADNVDAYREISGSVQWR